MDQLITGAAHDPHALPRRAPRGGRTVIRTLRRGADEVAVVVGDERHPTPRGARRGHLRGAVPRRGARLPGRRRRPGRRRPLPLPADPRRARPAPDRRGPARAAVGGARRAAARRRRRVHRLGAQRPRRTGGRRLHRLGPARRLADALAGQQRRVGALRARRGGRRTATSTGSSAADGTWREKADPLAAHRGAAGAPPRWSTTRVRLERRATGSPGAPPASRTRSR